MPWDVKDVKSQRIEFVARAVSGKETITGLCQEYGISRPTGYLWIKRYRKRRRFADLEEESRRPRRSPGRTAEAVEDRVVGWRKRTGWSGKKISQVLWEQEQIRIGRRTVDRIIQRCGLIREQDQPQSAPNRFEREAPNQLWQMDMKGQYRVGSGYCYPLSILDDHSRFLVGLHALAHPDHTGVETALRQTFQQYGVPDQMLMDHGVPWWGPSHDRGLTRLSVGLIQQGVRLIYSGIRHPQTQGKVERFHRTLKRTLAHRGVPERFPDWGARLEDIRHEYNHIRPHESLSMQTPAAHYRPSLRVWTPNPTEWEYPPGSEVRRLNTQGALWLGRHYWVSKALASQRVQLRRVDRRLLVVYRNMYVREIELTSGRSSMLICPVDDTAKV